LADHLAVDRRAIRRKTAGRLIGAIGAALTVSALIATEPAATAAEGTDSATAQAKMIAVFTGQFAQGMPVYRLPPVLVVANRKAELARIEREEQVRRIGQARARAATKPPA
jgi:hypothetical protein